MEKVHGNECQHVRGLSILPGYSRDPEWMGISAISLEFQAVNGQPFLPGHKAAWDYLRGSDLERANIYKTLNSIVDAEGNPAITVEEIRQAEDMIR